MPNYKLNLCIKTFTSIWSRLHLCCRGITRTCLRCLWPVGVGGFRLLCLQVSAATGTGLCRPSDPPDSLADAAPRGHRLWTSLGSRSGEKTWKKREIRPIDEKYETCWFDLGWLLFGCVHGVGPYPVGCIPGLFNELFDLLDVLSYVAFGGELRGQVVHLWDLIIQRWDGFKQVFHCK